MRSYLLAALVLIGSCSAAAQTPFVGVGYLECLHAGYGFGIGAKTSIEASLGIQPLHFEQNKIYTVGFGLFRKLPQKNALLFSYGLQNVLWNYNNQYNHFINLSVGPQLRFSKDFGQCNIQLAGGCAYNSVLLYERKTYAKVGWPNNWFPSFSITLFPNRIQK